MYRLKTELGLAMSSPSVLDGLRNSSKGRLSYKSQLDAVNFTDRRVHIVHIR